MDISHDHTDFGLWGPIFAFLTPKSIFFSCSMLNPRSMDISHEHTDFGPQIPFLGSEGSFSPFQPLKVYIFFIYIKFLIDGYITRPYGFWAPNSVFGLWGPIFAFLTTKSICFLHLYNISDRLMGHMTYLIFEPLSAQPRDSKFFWAKNTQHQITKCFAFLDF
jgi:hypothetical protein